VCAVYLPNNKKGNVMTFVKSSSSFIARPSKAIALAMATFFSSSALAANRYVDINASGGGIGSASSPWNNLQTALNNCAAGDFIHVAQGTYKPGSLRSDSFVLSTTSHQVQLQGGWINNGGGSWTFDPANAQTILSGNIGNQSSATDNCYTVLKLSNSGMTDSNTVISFLTIRDGYANGDPFGSPDSGGGVHITNGASPRLHRCVITNNKAASTIGNGAGAGVYVNAASPVFTLCTIESNSMTAAFKGLGAGLYSTGAGTVRLINCTIRQNTLSLRGGGIMAHSNGIAGNELIMVNCLVSANEVGAACSGGTCSSVSGGGVCIEGSSSIAPAAQIIGCTIVNNWSMKGGGGIRVIGGLQSSTTRTLQQCILWGNTDPYLGSGSQVSVAFNGSLSVRYCDVQDRSGDGVDGDIDWGTPDFNIDLDPQFVSSSNFRLLCTSPCINAGNPDSSVIPADQFDLNGNGHTSTERTPDLDLNWRIVGSGNFVRADMGAYEKQPIAPSVIGDLSPLRAEMVA
jgi:hypothetical protein